MVEATTMLLAGAGLVQVFYVITLLNRIVNGLNNLDERLAAFSEERRREANPAARLQARLLQELKSPGRPRP